MGGISEDSFERIRAVVCEIPRGRVATYGQVAAMAGMPRGARLVGYALHGLPKGTKIPWHRVVNAQGRISLPPRSAAYREQRRRLEAEGVTFLRGRINLEQHGHQATLDELLWKPLR
jgi:methylated-DNA-protein-cysteine methyltransferase-like protein